MPEIVPMEPEVLLKSTNVSEAVTLALVALIVMVWQVALSAPNTCSAVNGPVVPIPTHPELLMTILLVPPTCQSCRYFDPLPVPVSVALTSRTVYPAVPL